MPGVSAERFRHHRDALGWFAAERAAMVTATTRAADDGFYAHAWRLAWTLTQFLHAKATGTTGPQSKRPAFGRPNSWLRSVPRP